MRGFPKNCFSLNFILNNICVNRWNLHHRKRKAFKIYYLGCAF